MEEIRDIETAPVILQSSASTTTTQTGDEFDVLEAEEDAIAASLQREVDMHEKQEHTAALADRVRTQRAKAAAPDWCSPRTIFCIDVNGLSIVMALLLVTTGFNIACIAISDVGSTLFAFAIVNTCLTGVAAIVQTISLVVLFPRSKHARAVDDDYAYAYPARRRLINR